MLESEITTFLFGVIGNELCADEITDFIDRISKILRAYADLKEENTRLRLEYDNLYRAHHGVSVKKARSKAQAKKIVDDVVKRRARR